MSLRFVPMGLIYNIPALVQIMAWAVPATSHYLKQWWLVHRRMYASLGLSELTHWGRDEMDNISQQTFSNVLFNQNVWISIKISLKFVSKVLINNTQALVQIMAWWRPGDMSLSGPMMASVPTHICVTRPQWVNVGLDCSSCMLCGLTWPVGISTIFRGHWQPSCTALTTTCS